MSKPIRPAHGREQEPSEKCVICGHLETEHGITGLRPCLAMEGDLVNREFCECDSFRSKVSKAA